MDSWSIELTGKLESILSKQISIPVSPSTVTRIALKQQLPEIKQPRILGVDDWAYRKGVSYGTVLIDMETSRPIDLLSSRESSDLKKWLAKYPDTEIVTGIGPVHILRPLMKFVRMQFKLQIGFIY